ncbi:MAG: hypothetical protein ACD_76C00151G0009 [uncultured bacterium]|nr:MAG: hypothetical protein ACD_76C00151G0009 [uncultured bacterium]HBD04876.1 hypothetical protein [Candidatus Uhrbacteria bacterium]
MWFAEGEIIETYCTNDEFDGMMETLNQIRDRAQPHFANTLVVKSYEPFDPEVSGLEKYSYYFICEERRTKLLGFIPWKIRRELFAIRRGFVRNLSGDRTFFCAIYDSLIHGIVDEELAKYATRFNAPDIRLANRIKA